MSPALPVPGVAQALWVPQDWLRLGCAVGSWALGLLHCTKLCFLTSWCQDRALCLNLPIRAFMEQGLEGP